MEAMALIEIDEIDGLPIKNDDFPWQTVSHNQRVETISIALMLTPGPEMFDT